jgi:hypothetical protein
MVNQPYMSDVILQVSYLSYTASLLGTSGLPHVRPPSYVGRLPCQYADLTSLKSSAPIFSTETPLDV